jgi:hypothetical protein
MALRLFLRHLRVASFECFQIKADAVVSLLDPVFSQQEVRWLDKVQSLDSMEWKTCSDQRLLLDFPIRYCTGRQKCSR